MIKQYAKALIYIALAAVSVLVTALTDDVVSPEELVNVGIVGVGAIATYLVPNLPTGPGAYAKSATAFIVAGLIAVASALTGGITTAEWLQIGVAAFAGIGVYIVPNEQPKQAGSYRPVVPRF
jgi:hypothetical protein